MFDQLPKSVQEQVLKHLQSNDFKGAKAIYDQCLKHEKQQNPPKFDTNQDRPFD